MKEYDIFLKRRLTEGTIIVYSLPFRDGVSAVNRVVLQAMLSYFSLQKKIAVANQSVLVAEVDEMLATVSEKIGDQVCLKANAALTTKYRNELVRQRWSWIFQPSRCLPRASSLWKVKSVSKLASRLLTPRVLLETQRALWQS